MTSSTLPITGADYFLCALDRQMRRAGLPGNLCRLVARLEGRPDPQALADRVARSAVFGTLARTRMARPLPFLSPRWRLDGPAGPPVFRAVDLESHPLDPLHALPEHDLRHTNGPLLALDLLRGPRDASHLVLSWHHALMDVRGAELLVHHLGGEDPGDVAGVAGAEGGPLAALRAFPGTLAFGRQSLAFINQTCREPFASLYRAQEPGRGVRNRYRVRWFNAEETGRIDEHCRHLEAGFRRSLFYLAASARAVQALAAGRGGTPGACVVPMPHDLRRRGTRGPILSNHLTILFFRVEAGDLPGTISSLTEQMLEQVRGRTAESFHAAMDLFRPLPLGFYLRALGRPTEGRLATFFFSDAGESCPGLEELAGARLAAVTHLPPAAAPPGLGVVFSRFRDRLCFVLSWTDGGPSVGEIDRLEERLAAGLLGEGEA